MNVLRFVDRVLPTKLAFAHCDVPCGIYRAQPMITAAEAVVAMVGKILNPPVRDEKSQQSIVDFHNNMTRYVIVKEDEAEKCKREVLILWTDFFKAEHLHIVPDLHDKVWRIVKLCSDNKRAADKAKADELLKSVKEIGAVFEKVQNSS